MRFPDRNAIRAAHFPVARLGDVLRAIYYLCVVHRFIALLIAGVLLFVPNDLPAGLHDLMAALFGTTVTRRIGAGTVSITGDTKVGCLGGVGRQGEQKHRHNRQTNESFHLPISFADNTPLNVGFRLANVRQSFRRPDPSEGLCLWGVQAASSVTSLANWAGIILAGCRLRSSICIEGLKWSNWESTSRHRE